MELEFVKAGECLREDDIYLTHDPITVGIFHRNGSLVRIGSLDEEVELVSCEGFAEVFTSILHDEGLVTIRHPLITDEDKLHRILA